MKRIVGRGGRRCRSGKVRYRDHISAARALVILQGRGERRGKTLTRCYPCPSCLGWHLTSQD
jgi:hypothetical protein